MKPNIIQNFKHLLFSIICIALVQITAIAGTNNVDQVSTINNAVYGAEQQMPIDGNTVELVKIIVQGIIGLVHVIVSLRNDRRAKRAEKEYHGEVIAGQSGTNTH